MEKIVARKFRNTIPLFKESQSAFSYIAGKARAGGRGGGMANKLTFNIQIDAECLLRAHKLQGSEPRMACKV